MKKESQKKAEESKFIPMSVVHPDAAGIDIGDTIHAVAVPKDRDVQSVRMFGTMSCDLRAIVAWLKICFVDTVAMESTGVYWKSLALLLIQEGFEVFLVNARHVKNVSGWKTDQGDAEWIQYLHTCGLLKSSYLPEDTQESLSRRFFTTGGG
jgi:transposase